MDTLNEHKASGGRVPDAFGTLRTYSPSILIACVFLFLADFRGASGATSSSPTSAWGGEELRSIGAAASGLVLP